MTIIKELDALHVNWEEYKFPAGEWDMKYADFSLVEKTGATVTLDLFSYVEPSANFTVNAPSEIKEGQMYILRVVTWVTPYTMTLWTWITNPYSESTTLLANTVHQFGFLAVDWNLELQPSVTQSWWWEWWTITWTLSNQTDLQTALNAKADASDINVKSFYIPNTSDLTTAQAAYEYMSIGTPILRMGSMYDTSAWTLTFFPVKKVNPGASWTMIFLATQLSKTTVNAYTMIFQDRVEFTITNWQVTAITTQFTNSNSTLFRCLETHVNYGSTYTPQYDWSPATKKYVDDNIVQNSATAPSSPTEWMVWYDTTNDVLKVYDGTNWNSIGESNTKTFDVSDLTVAELQPVIDYYTNWWYPIIYYDDENWWHTNPWCRWYYTLAYPPSNSSATFVWTMYNANTFSSVWSWQSTSTRLITINLSDWAVTSASFQNLGFIHYLSTSETNWQYTPANNYDPATKKYVDDNVAYVWSSAPSSPSEWRLWYDTTNDVLKSYDGTNWNECWGWINKSWVTKTVSSWEIELGIRTLVNDPSANFTLTKPATLIDWEEYAIRINSWSTARTMTLWTGFTNPWNVSLSLNAQATDQFVFLAINNTLELQPLITIS